MNIYDIAQKSGVSIATVSRVLNGGQKVSPKTYDKIIKIMEAEGYTPNAFARGLGLNTMQTVGILVSDVADPSYATMVSVLTSELRNLGFNIILGCTGFTLQDKINELKLLQSKRVDAIFLAGSAQQELRGNSHIKEAASAVPIILINGYINAPGIINVAANESGGLYQAVTALKAAGCRRPLYIYNHLTYSGQQKLKGFKAGVKECDLIHQEDLVMEVTGSLAEATRQMQQRVSNGSDFDSLIASEDLLAIAAQKALLEADQDMPVIGFNNSILAEAATPALTSIDNMQAAVCKLAVQMYHEAAQGKKVSSNIRVDCQLVERQSFILKK